MASFRYGLLASSVATLVALLPLQAKNAGEATWSQFRGPNATGIAPGPLAPPSEFGPGKNLLWQSAVTSGHSSPAIWGDRIFLTAYDTERRKLQVLAVNRKTGELRWRRDIDSEQIEKVHALSSPATATPVVDGDRVYAYFGSYGLVSFDLNGNRQWELRTSVAETVDGSGTSPILAGELLILNRDDFKDPFLIAVDRKSGKTVWKHAHPPPVQGSVSHATPVIWQQQIVLHRGAGIEGYDVASGHRQWWVSTATRGTSTPAIAGEAIYVSTWTHLGEADQRVPLPDFAALLQRADRDGNGQISEQEFPDDLAAARRPDTPSTPGATVYLKPFFKGIDGNKDGLLQKDEWDSGLAVVAKMTQDHGLLAIKAGGSGDVTSTHVMWKETSAIPEVPSPLAYENRVYMVRNGGVLTCVDAATGKLRYRNRLGAGGPYYSSPVAAAGKIFLASGEGTIVVLAAGDTFDVLAKNELHEPIFATPAVLDGVLYVRTAAHLFAFAQKSPTAR
jgi:outer membrane protein assembly factor BamB